MGSIMNTAYCISHYKVGICNKPSDRYWLNYHWVIELIDYEQPSPLPMDLSEYETDCDGNKYKIEIRGGIFIALAMDRPPTENDVYLHLIKYSGASYSMIKHPTEEHTTLQKLLWEV